MQIYTLAGYLILQYCCKLNCIEIQSAMKISKRKDKEKIKKQKLMESHRKAYLKEQKLLCEAGFIKSVPQNGSIKEALDKVPPPKLAIPKRNKGRQYTVSVALPGSILDNAQTSELRTYLAGQIARACVVFQVIHCTITDHLFGLQISA